MKSYIYIIILCSCKPFKYYLSFLLSLTHIKYIKRFSHYRLGHHSNSFPILLYFNYLTVQLLIVL